jgi:hypothetical protein
LSFSPNPFNEWFSLICHINFSFLQKYTFFRTFRFFFLSLPITIDYIKADKRRGIFIHDCPEFIIVDEAHTCALPQHATSKTQQQRYALHLSEEERHTVIDCLHKIDTELRRPADKHSRRLITANIGLLLDYCMRFYERQFTTREASNKDIIVRFEQLLDEYFDGQTPQEEGLPTVKYFAERVFLSPNYFGDMISKQTVKVTPSSLVSILNFFTRCPSLMYSMSDT